MTRDDLSERLRAVERALTDADTAVADLSEKAAVQKRLADIEADLDVLGERVDALDATVQSLHGYVGELEHVNDRVERRADAARAAVERLDDEQRRRQPADPPANRPTESDPGTSDSPAQRVSEAGADGAMGDEGIGREAIGAEAVGDEAIGAESSDEDEASEASLLDRVRESL